MDFENLTSEDLIKKPPKAVNGKKHIHTGVRIKVNNVYVYIKEKGLVGVRDTDDVWSLEELLSFQLKEPNGISSFQPPLYSIFKSAIDGKLQPYVAVGDRVRYVKAIYMPSGTTMNDEFTVTNVELSSLGNMSVFVAALDNGDTTVLTNFLKKV